MTQLLNIQTPTLLLDKQKALRNLERMAKKAHQSNVRFRPHFKTHQSAEIGDWFRDFGVTSITVSSLRMAEYFANHGWNDITVAFLVNTLEIDRMRALSERIKLGVIVESVDRVKFLQQQLKHPIQVWQKIDTGYGRTGIQWGDFEIHLQIAKALNQSDMTQFQGLLAHAGHTYATLGTHKKVEIYDTTVQRVNQVRDRLAEAGFNDLKVSIGDTPGCSVIDNFGNVSEVRPGNFIFYDWTQHSVGSCDAENIAVAMACPIVAKYPEKKSLTVYGGAVHFSKDSFTKDGRISFGAVVPWQNDHWGLPLDRVHVASLSQEHGLIEFGNQSAFDSYSVGDVMLVLPIHSCLTADKMGAYRTLEGETISMMRL
jgi:D-serine deaminase-like pyridoxal phosphate-dependent protein